MRRLGSVLLMCCFAGASASAQTAPDPLEAPTSPADSAAAAAAVLRPALPFGSSVTLRDIQREYGQLRLRPDARQGISESQIGTIRLVVDETISRAGGQFFDVFYQLWQPPADASFASVVLSEQPLPGQGTLVSVRLDGEVVFQSRLQPKEDVIEQTAQIAVQTTLRRLGAS